MTDHLTNGGQLTEGGGAGLRDVVRAGSDPAYRGQSAMTTGLRSALWLPLFGDLADPVVVARLAAEAEEAGWHGIFVWDHLRWQAPVRQVADPWITLAAVAAATERLRLGPMVTPLARRRPAKVARETVTLDWLSGGRLTLGVGLGSDRFGGELSATGEQLDGRRRSQMLDEALQILTGAWSGQSVHHHGEHYTVDGIQFLPRPVRQRVPVWVAGFPGNLGPVRRAARHDGFFPVNVEHPGQLAEIAAAIAGLRQHTTGPYDIAIALPPGTDLAPYAEAGATWWLAEFQPETISLSQVRGVIRDGPAAGGGLAAGARGADLAVAVRAKPGVRLKPASSDCAESSGPIPVRLVL